MKFVTKRIHAYLDYPVALALIAMPFLLGLGNSSNVALWLSVFAGAAALVLTILTDHHLGIVRLIPYEGHLFVDFLVGVSFVIIPFMFSFKGIDAYYYWINGAAVITVVSLHKSETESSINQSNI